MASNSGPDAIPRHVAVIGVGIVGVGFAGRDPGLDTRPYRIDRF